MVRLRWKATITGQDLEQLLDNTAKSIAEIQNEIDEHHVFVPYTTGGAEKARTLVNWPPADPKRYETTQQRHSEMVALTASTAPPAIWHVDQTGHVIANNGHDITGANYVTDLPHCGYCTVMIWVLGLPLGQPTKGRYNQAVNLGYSIPVNVQDNVDVLTRLLNSNQGGNPALVVLKCAVNAFIATPPSKDWVLSIEGKIVTDTAVLERVPAGKEVLDWADAAAHRVAVDIKHFGTNSLLVTLWKVVYKALYNNVD